MPSDLNLIKNPACTLGPGRAHADKNRRQMAARPLGLSPERGCETRAERSGGRGKPDKGRGGQGRQRSMEIWREKEERWEQALSWCNFLGACILRSGEHLCCLPICLAWRVERERTREIEEKHQVIPKGRPVEACKWAFAQYCPLQHLIRSTASQASDEVRREPHKAEQTESSYTSSVPSRGLLPHSSGSLWDLHAGRDGATPPEDPQFVYQTHSY